MRAQIEVMHNSYIDFTQRINDAMERGKFSADVGAVEALMDKKKYLTTLIRKKIFRKEDIYGKVFASDKDFDTLKKLFAKFKKARESAK